MSVDTITSMVAGHAPTSGRTFIKTAPGTGTPLLTVVEASSSTIDRAIANAVSSHQSWSDVGVTERGVILEKAIGLLAKQREMIAGEIGEETGRPKKHVLGEVDAAIACGRFFVEESKRMSAISIRSGVAGRTIELRQDSLGPGLLITPFNNPLAGIAWKAFPALLCGNSIIIKAHELTPRAPIIFAKALVEAGVPEQVISVIQGDRTVGQTLVLDSRFTFISFTGSNNAGSAILGATAPQLTRVSIEAGGKNPFIVCADANMEVAVDKAVQSAFVDAGQRCAAASRFIIVGEVYDDFARRFVEKASMLKVGISDDSDYGAIISDDRLSEILHVTEGAVARGAKVLLRGERLSGSGSFLSPTILECADPKDEIAQKEIFGPVVTFHRVSSLEEAIVMANGTGYGLSSAIHTRTMADAEKFVTQYHGGVVRINGPTHGSEPHVPFGGEGLSGNGWREPGFAALQFYSSLKQVSKDS